MSARNCVIPLVVRFRGIPGDDRLDETSDAIARAVAARLAQADRVIAARESWPSWNRKYGTPQIRFADPALDEGMKRRLAAAIESGIARGIGGGLQPAAARRFEPSPYQLVDLPAQAKPAAQSPADPDDGIDDGLKIARGGHDIFWKAVRSLVFTPVLNGVGQSDRDEGIRILIQGIQRTRAQALIREVLEGPTSGARITLILALGKEKQNRILVWRMLLHGVNRPDDLMAFGPFDDQLNSDPDPIIDFFEQVLAGGEEPYRKAVGKVIRRYLEGQFDPHNAARQHAYDRLRRVAAKFNLYSTGPLGVDATRERLERVIDVLIDTIPVILDPLTPTTPRETAQTNDEHTLDGLKPTLVTLKGSLKSLAPDLIAALETRLTVALEMASVLPDRISTIQQLIRAFADKLTSATDPSDEIVVLQELRRRYLLAFASSPNTDDALKDFNKAEDTFADLRDAVADVKFNRLSREFDNARAAVGYGKSLKRSGGRIDPQFDGMWELLYRYTQAFVEIFAPHGPVQAIATSYESTVQLETDLGLYRILGAMFLQYSVALRYDEDVEASDTNSDFKKHIHYRTWLLCGQIARYWSQEDYQGYLGKAADIKQTLDDLGAEIKAQQQRDADTRTAILLAATLVAGVAGIIVRAALIGVLLETAAGATRLAIAVTVAEATAFTATQLGLEYAAFGKPITVSGAAKAWASNVVQFAAFSSLSKVLGPLGPSGRTWLSFAGRHAAGLVFQADISLLMLAVQGRDFPTDIRNFLIETIGAYAIGSTLGYIGQHTQNARVEAFKNDFAAVEGDIFRKYAEAAARTGRVDEATFNKTKADLLDHWSRVEAAATRLRDAGFMSPEEFKATQDIVSARKTALSSLNYPKPPPGGPRTYTGPLLLEPSKVPGLVKAGPTEIYRYDPQRPPARLGELVASYQRIPTLRTTFEKGTLVVRELGTGRLMLMIGPGPIPAGLLAPPPPHAPPPQPLTFVESAAGGALTPVGLASMTAAINRINRGAIAELQARGDPGMAALSLLIKYRVTLRPWPIAAVRGLGTALELPRAITKANIERFFARSSDEIAALFQSYNDVADMPGADIAFRLPATQRTVLVLDLYHDLRARNIKLPAGMNESALRGMLNMLQTLGRDVAIETILDTGVDKRLALLTTFDSTRVVTPPVPAAQLILDRHAGDISPGINLADTKQSPADVRAQIEAYAQAHGGGFDSHIPARIEAAIRDYRATLRRVQDGTETDSRNLDGTREEFRAMFLALDRGAQILAFSRNLGAAAGDPFQVQIDVGWHPLRGRVTVQHAPKDVKVQLDLLAHTATGLEIEEVTAAELDLPAPLNALAKQSGAVTVDWSALNNTTSHRKWKQILKNIALVEFGEELARSWGGSPAPVQLTVRARSASGPAAAALTKLGVNLQLITP